MSKRLSGSSNFDKTSPKASVTSNVDETLQNATEISNVEETSPATVEETSAAVETLETTSETLDAPVEDGKEQDADNNELFEEIVHEDEPLSDTLVDENGEAEVSRVEDEELHDKADVHADEIEELHNKDDDQQNENGGSQDEKDEPGVNDQPVNQDTSLQKGEAEITEDDELTLGEQHGDQNKEIPDSEKVEAGPQNVKDPSTETENPGDTEPEQGKIEEPTMSYEENDQEDDWGDYDEEEYYDANGEPYPRTSGASRGKSQNDESRASRRSGARPSSQRSVKDDHRKSSARSQSQGYAEDSYDQDEAYDYYEDNNYNDEEFQYGEEDYDPSYNRQSVRSSRQSKSESASRKSTGIEGEEELQNGEEDYDPSNNRQSVRSSRKSDAERVSRKSTGIKESHHDNEELQDGEEDYDPSHNRQSIRSSRQSKWESASRKSTGIEGEEELQNGEEDYDPSNNRQSVRSSRKSDARVSRKSTGIKESHHDNEDLQDGEEDYDPSHNRQSIRSSRQSKWESASRKSTGIKGEEELQNGEEDYDPSHNRQSVRSSRKSNSSSVSRKSTGIQKSHHDNRELQQGEEDHDPSHNRQSVRTSRKSDAERASRKSTGMKIEEELQNSEEDYDPPQNRQSVRSSRKSDAERASRKSTGTQKSHHDNGEFQQGEEDYDPSHNRQSVRSSRKSDAERASRKSTGIKESQSVEEELQNGENDYDLSHNRQSVRSSRKSNAESGSRKSTYIRESRSKKTPQSSQVGSNRPSRVQIPDHQRASHSSKERPKASFSHRASSSVSLENFSRAHEASTDNAPKHGKTGEDYDGETHPKRKSYHNDKSGNEQMRISHESSKQNSEAPRCSCLCNRDLLIAADAIIAACRKRNKSTFPQEKKSSRGESLPRSTVNTGEYSQRSVARLSENRKSSIRPSVRYEDDSVSRQSSRSMISSRYGTVSRSLASHSPEVKEERDSSSGRTASTSHSVSHYRPSHATSHRVDSFAESRHQSHAWASQNQSVSSSPHAMSSRLSPFGSQAQTGGQESVSSGRKPSAAQPDAQSSRYSYTSSAPQAASRSSMSHDKYSVVDSQSQQEQRSTFAGGLHSSRPHPPPTSFHSLSATESASPYFTADTDQWGSVATQRPSFQSQRTVSFRQPITRGSSALASETGRSVITSGHQDLVSQQSSAPEDESSERTFFFRNGSVRRSLTSTSVVSGGASESRPSQPISNANSQAHSSAGSRISHILTAAPSDRTSLAMSQRDREGSRVSILTAAPTDRTSLAMSQRDDSRSNANTGESTGGNGRISFGPSTSQNSRVSLGCPPPPTLDDLDCVPGSSVRPSEIRHQSTVSRLSQSSALQDGQEVSRSTIPSRKNTSGVGSFQVLP
ncbi:microtubule-associated protein futsch [Aplysia californica]|uniref:Microtubule-associated protein futsch n=1 Tax=Aplysia californica TaxID=6500 RepID=A0ABM0JJZ5_APLCA|nr:microtubule-associated protein futsch [Aplysia californica]